MNEAERERIEQELEGELGFCWTPQMHHGYKALKLWNALVSARAEVERLQDETVLLKLITKEQDELRAVVQEIENGGDNPDLWGALVAQRNQLQTEVKRLLKWRRCQDELLVAYRLGSRPSMKCLDELDALKAAEARGDDGT